MPMFVDTSPPGQCIFCRLVAGEIPAATVYEDALTIAFMDIGQVNPGHVLVANLTGDALKSAAQGLQLDPASPYPALLAIELVERGQGEAEVLVRRHLADARTPADSPVPLAYARLPVINRANSHLFTLPRSSPACVGYWWQGCGGTLFVWPD